MFLSRLIRYIVCSCLHYTFLSSLRRMETEEIGHPCIYRVPKLQRRLNNEAYTPILVSIGPFHHKDETLSPMNVHKKQYVDYFIEQSNANGRGGDIDTYRAIVKENEDKIRRSYAEDFRGMISDVDFVKMVLDDSLFVIMTLRDTILLRPFTFEEVLHDMKLAENQLSFFILSDLYSAAFEPCDTISGVGVDGDARSFFDVACEGLEVDKSRVDRKTCHHLLDLLRSHHLPSPRSPERALGEKTPSCCHIIIDMMTGCHDQDDDDVCLTAMSLRNAGVKFQLGDKKNSSLDIHFDEKTGTLTLPELSVDNMTECLFRNLIAFEQCYYGKQSHFIHYRFFMDRLIDSSEDVRLLSKAGIIHSFLGSDHQVADLINSLGTHVLFDSTDYCYASVTEQLKIHCRKKWNRYRAILMHTYLKHPWAVISVVYVSILLSLTVLQVVCGFLAL